MMAFATCRKAPRHDGCNNMATTFPHRATALKPRADDRASVPRSSFPALLSVVVRVLRLGWLYHALDFVGIFRHRAGANRSLACQRRHSGMSKSRIRWHRVPGDVI